jgi:hypothetical protein
MADVALGFRWIVFQRVVPGELVGLGHVVGICSDQWLARREAGTSLGRVDRGYLCLGADQDADLGQPVWFDLRRKQARLLRHEGEAVALAAARLDEVLGDPEEAA